MMDALNAFLQTLFVPGLQSIGAAFLFLTAASGLGELLWGKFKKPEISYPFGLVLMMILWGGLPCRAWILWSFLTPFALFGLYRLLPLCRRHQGVVLGGAALFLCFAGAALLPPYSWDEQTYQLALPLRALKNGFYGFCPDNPYSAYPALTGMFFSRAICIGGFAMAKLVVSFQTIVLALLIWVQCRRYSKSAAWSMTAVFLLSPLTLVLNRALYVENFVAVLTAGGVLAAFALREEKKWYTILICGLLAGWCVAVKPTGAIGAVLIGGAVLTAGNSKKLLGVVGVAFLTAFPWYYRTFAATGNPLYPYSFFAEPGSVEAFHHLLGSARYGLEGLPGAALSWVAVGFMPKLYDGIGCGWAIPVITAAGVIVLWLQYRKNPISLKCDWSVLAAGISAYLLWVFGAKQSRFLFPLIPLLLIGAAKVLSEKKKLFLLFIALAAAAPGVFYHVKHYATSTKLLPLAQKNPAHFLAVSSRDKEYFQTLDALCRTPEDAKVLLLLERRGLYVPRRYSIAYPGFEPSLTPVPENAALLFEKVRNFDYIIVGASSQDVDFQELSIDNCKTILNQLEMLIAQGKLARLNTPGYPLLKVVRK